MAKHQQQGGTQVMALNLHEPCSPVPDVVVPRACAPVVALVLLLCWCFVCVGVRVRAVGARIAEF